MKKNLIIIFVIFPTILFSDTVRVDNSNSFFEFDTKSIFKSDKCLYVSVNQNDFEGIIVYNVEDPKNTVEIGRISGINAEEIFVYNTFLFCEQSSALYVYDISDYSTPNEIYSYPIYSIKDFRLKNNYLYLLTSNIYRTPTIIIFDIGNMQDIQKTSELSYADEDGWQDTEGFCISKDSNLLFFSGWKGYQNPTRLCSDLRIIDISNPYNMQEIGSVQTNYSFCCGIMCDIEFFMNKIVMSDGENGLLVINIDKPWAPFIEQTLFSGKTIQYVASDNKYFYFYENVNWESLILYIYKFDDNGLPLKMGQKKIDRGLPFHKSNSILAGFPLLCSVFFDSFEVYEISEIPSYNIPHIDWSSQWSSYLIADNGNDTSGSVRVYLYDKEGTELSMK